MTCNTVSRIAITVVAALAVVASVMLVWVAYLNGASGMLADDAIYLLMADWFSDVTSGTRSTTAFVWQHSQFPPLYPMVLGLLGGTTRDVGYAHALTAAMTVGGAVAGYAWMQAKRTLSPMTCLTLIAWWMLLPKTVFASIETMSEPLYVVLTFSALAMSERDRDAGRIAYAAVALIILSSLTRTIAFTLVIAFLVQSVRATSLRATWRVALICIGPMFLWSVISTRWFGAGRVYLGEPSEYFSGITLSNFLSNLFVRWPITFFDAWLAQFQTIEIPVAKAIYATVLALSIVGLLTNLRHGALDAKYVTLYLIVVWLWPYPDHVHRFLWPVMPALLFYSAEVALSLVEKARMDPCKVRTGTVLIVVAVASVNWSVLAQRFMKDIPRDIENYRGSRFNLRTDDPQDARTNVVLFRALTDALRKVGAMVPEDECIVASNRDLMMLFGRRPSVFPPLPALDDLSFRNRLECRYVFVQDLMPNPYLPAGYPASRIPDKRILARIQVPASPGPVDVGTLFEVTQ